MSWSIVQPCHNSGLSEGKETPVLTAALLLSVKVEGRAERRTTLASATLTTYTILKPSLVLMGGRGVAHVRLIIVKAERRALRHTFTLAPVI